MPTRIYNTSGQYYSITTNSYLDIPNNNSDTLSKVETYLISSKDIDIKAAHRDDLLIHIYEEATDIEYWVPLSAAFITDMAKRGYQILCKLGAGSGHITFLAYNGSKFVTLLINDNVPGTRGDRELFRLTSSKILKLEDKVTSLSQFRLYFNVIYDTIYSPIPYSDNTEYKRLSMPNYEDRRIYVLEYLSYTVEEMIINKKLIWSKEEYQIFREQVESFLYRALTYLRSQGYIYGDMKPDNIMIGYCSGLSYLKLIDIESIGPDNGIDISTIVNHLLVEMDEVWNT